MVSDTVNVNMWLSLACFWMQHSDEINTPVTDAAAQSDWKHTGGEQGGVFFFFGL